MAHIVIEAKWLGEAFFIRDEALKFISPEMNGIDIGSGGVPVLIQAISMDSRFPSTYADLVQLKGDARNLYWFRDDVLDYVFSSHCLEDFEPDEKKNVLTEWVRVLKPGGFLLLYLPDERRYRDVCRRSGSPLNLDHKDPDFGITSVREMVKLHVPNLEEVYCIEKFKAYSFFIVFVKN